MFHCFFNATPKLPCHGFGLPKRMHIDGLYGTGHFTAEAGPAILGVCDLRLFSIVHDDHVSRANHFAYSAPHASDLINIANHPSISFRVWDRDLRRSKKTGVGESD